MFRSDVSLSICLGIGVLSCRATDPSLVKSTPLMLPAEIEKVREAAREGLVSSGAENAAFLDADRIRRDAEVEASARSERARFDRLVRQGGFGAASRAGAGAYLDTGRPPRGGHDDSIGNWNATQEELSRRIEPCTQPEIAATSVDPIQSTKAVVIEGCSFGDSPGTIELAFPVLSSGDQGRAARDPCEASSVRSRISLTAERPSDWKNDQIYLTIPALRGYLDQDATLQVVRADGARSESFPVRFFAMREARIVPAHYFDFAIENPRTDDNVQEPLACTNLNRPGEPTWKRNESFSVDHFHGCCYPQVTGHDSMTVKLINGWQFLDLATLREGGYTTLDLFNEPGNFTREPWPSITSQGTTSEIEIQCDWWVDHVESGLRYTVALWIEGPAGTRFADPARFQWWECTVGKPCPLP